MFSISTNMKKNSRLQFPLLIYSNDCGGGIGILPKGTTLYFHKSFSEGIERYICFINIEGGRLPLEETDKINHEIPLTAFIEDVYVDENKIENERSALKTEDIILLLKSFKITKKDLEKLIDELDD